MPRHHSFPVGDPFPGESIPCLNITSLNWEVRKLLNLHFSAINSSFWCRQALTLPRKDHRTDFTEGGKNLMESCPWWDIQDTLHYCWVQLMDKAEAIQPVAHAYCHEIVASSVVPASGLHGCKAADHRCSDSRWRYGLKGLYAFCVLCSSFAETRQFVPWRRECDLATHS